MQLSRELIDFQQQQNGHFNDSTAGDFVKPFFDSLCFCRIQTGSPVFSIPDLSSRELSESSPSVLTESHMTPYSIPTDLHLLAGLQHRRPAVDHCLKTDGEDP